MALQVGELFASFGIDTSGAERALAEMEARFLKMETAWMPSFAAAGRAAVEAARREMSEKAGAESGSAFLTGLRGGADAAGEALAEAFRRAGSAAVKAGRETLSAAEGAAIGAAFGREMIGGLEGTSRDARAAAERIGTDFGQGAISGMNAMRGSVQAAASRLGADAAAALRSALDSHSPSRVTEAVGADFAAGFVNALDAGRAAAGAAAGAMARAAAGILEKERAQAAKLVRDAWDEGLAARTQITEKVRMEMTPQSVYGKAATLGETARGFADGERAERLAERCARLVADALEGVTVVMDSAAVGTLVAPSVSAAIARGAAARRYGTA